MTLPGQQIINGVSNFIAGTQQVPDFGNPNTVINTPAIQSQIKAAGFTIMRMPVGNGTTAYSDSEIDQRIAACTACGCVPLIILGHDTGMTFARHVVTYAGSRCNLYEIYNEPDLNPNINGVSNYISDWNTLVPQLRAINPNAAFGGPVLGVVANFNSYLQPWLAACKTSGVLPDFVSFHDYPCGSQPSQAVCATKAPNIGKDAANLRAIITSTLGYSLPIGVTEWNIDYHTTVVSYAAASNPANAAFINQWYTDAIASMVTNGVAISCQFDAAGNAENGDADLISVTSPYPQQDGYSAFKAAITSYLGTGGGGGGSTTITASPGTLTFSGTQGGSNPATQTVTLTNTGTATGSWSISVAYDSASGTNSWLTSSQASGSLAAGATTTIQIGALLGSLAPGTYTATVTYPGNGTTTQTVTFTVAASGSTLNPLSVYFAAAASTTQSTGNELYVTTGTPSGTTQTYTTFGTGTGWVEIAAQGNGSATLAGSIGSPTGKGFFLDPATLTLAGNRIPLGSWGAVVRLNASRTSSNPQAGTLSATINVRLWKYNTTSGIYSAIATMALGGQSITSAFTSYTLAVSNVSAQVFAASETLYVDIWVDVTANNNGGNLNQGIRLNRLSTDTTNFYGDGNAVITTPGYQSSGAANLTASPSSLAYAGVSGVSDPSPQNVTITNTTASSGSWTSSINYGSGSGWLSLSPTSGTLSAGGTATIAVTASNLAASLAAGTYTATITFTKGADTATVTVTLTVTNTATAVISASPSSLSYSGQVGTSPAAQSVVISNIGSNAGSWASNISYAQGSGWLALSPTSGTLTPGTPVTITVTANLSGLAVGTYSATITFTLGSTSTAVSVSLFVSATGGIMVVTIGGDNLFRDGSSGANNPIISYIALGSGTTAPQNTDTRLIAETFRKRISSYTNGINAGEVLISAYIGDGEAVGLDIEEVGLYGGSAASSTANSGVLVARGLYHHSPKSNLESVQLNFDLLFKQSQ